MRDWYVILPDGTRLSAIGFCQRSQAKADAKRQLGIKGHGRLPKGTVVVEQPKPIPPATPRPVIDSRPELKLIRPDPDEPRGTDATPRATDGPSFWKRMLWGLLGRG